MNNTKVLNLNLFGKYGSGKGTQRQLLMQKFGLPCLETGEIIRDEMVKGTELGKKFDRYIAEGSLVPDEDVFTIVRNFFATHPRDRGVIFDGLPRTLAQKTFFDAEMKRLGREPLNIEIAISDETSLARQLSRHEDRADQNEAIAKKRIQIYHHNIAPVIAAYQKEGKMITVSGEGSRDEVQESILKILEEHGYHQR